MSSSYAMHTFHGLVSQSHQPSDSDLQAVKCLCGLNTFKINKFKSWHDVCGKKVTKQT